MTAVVEPRTVLPPKDEPNLAELLRALSSSDVSICNGAGNPIRLPREIRDAFYNVALAMSKGKGIQLVPHGMILTTQEAADMLNVSRPTLVKLLEDGRIPYEKPGRHRRIRLEALLEYQEATRVMRRSALREATQESADEIEALLKRG